MSVYLNALALGAKRLGAGEAERRDALILLGHALGLDRGNLHRVESAEITDKSLSLYESFLERRSKGEPVARILGYRDFWNHRFRVTPDVLDPRPDTETLVAEALRRPFARLLDLGTGSGCIAISLLAERRGATGVATDLSQAALRVASENAQEIGISERLELRESDWFESVEGQFDLIISNPPYIAEAAMGDLARDVRDWDPHMALTPGGDGLAPYREIAAKAPQYLQRGGWLMAEIGYDQGQAVAELWRDAGLEDVAVVQDFDRRDRVVIGRMG